MGLYDFTFYDLIRRNALVFGDRTAWHEVDDRAAHHIQLRSMDIVVWNIVLQFPIPRPDQVQFLVNGKWACVAERRPVYVDLIASGGGIDRFLEIVKVGSTEARVVAYNPGVLCAKLTEDEAD